jgi:PIN domain nuclease of toxin-antitoxin system
MKPYVLDACALIAYFNDEAGADVVEALFAENKELVVSMLNVYEVYYHAVRTSGEENAKSLLDDIEALPVKIIKDISKDIIIEAAKFKVDYSLSLADSIALGLGKHLNAYVVTADHHEFDILEEKKLVDFFWIRPKKTNIPEEKETDTKDNA